MAVVETNANVASSSSGTSHTNTFGFTGTSGRLLIAIAAADAGSDPVMSTGGWTLCMPNPASGRLATWFRISNGTETAFTVTTSITTKAILGVLECSGPEGSLSALDLGTENSGTGTAMNSGTSRPAAPDGEGVAYACFTTTTAVTWTPDAGWASEWDFSTSGGGTDIYLYVMRKYPPTSDVQQCAVTTNTSAAWQAVMVSFKKPLPPNLPSTVLGVG